MQEQIEDAQTPAESPPQVELPVERGQESENEEPQPRAPHERESEPTPHPSPETPGDAGAPLEPQTGTVTTPTDKPPIRANDIRAAKPEEVKETKETEREPRREDALRELTAHELQKIEEVCVLPQSITHGELGRDAKVLVVYGPENTGKFTCAVRLGLDLLVGTPSADAAERGVLMNYRIGLDRLFKQIGLDHPRYRDALAAQQQLIENLDAMRFGDTETLRATRNRILDHLNHLAMDVLRTSFNQLCISVANVARAHIKVYRRSPRERRTLTDLLQTSSLAEGDICVIENVLINEADFAELSEELLALVDSKNYHLILTSIFQPDPSSGFPDYLGRIATFIDDDPARARFMHDVLHNHLRFYRQSIDDAVQTQVLGQLRLPRQIDEFCRRRTRLPPNAAAQQEIELAAEIAGYSDPRFLRSWFENLDENAKLYAMLIALFGELNHSILDDIYLVAVKRLRDDGVTKLNDSRQYGLNDIFEKTHAVEHARAVSFADRAFELEVRHQIGNYRHLLWSLMDILLQLIEHYRAPYYWEFRKALGVAIGQLGHYYANELEPTVFVNKLEALLHTLALHESGGVVAVVGYALDELCRASSEYHAFVTNLLKNWVESGDPDLMWASAAAVWRIYDGLARTAQADGGSSLAARRAADTLSNIRTTFAELAKTFDQFSDKARRKALVKILQPDRPEDVTLSPLREPEIARQVLQQLTVWALNNVSSILYAVRWIAIFDAEYAIRQINEWLSGKDDNLCALGQSASLQLFTESTDPEVQLIEERHKPLLDLIGPLLRTDQEVVNTILQALLEWVRRPDWLPRVHHALLKAANRATEDEAIRLIDGLSHEWLNSDVFDARRIGQSLIARACAILGMPVDLPGRYIAVILDGSRGSRLNRLSALLGRELYERLDSQVETRVAQLGDIRVFAQSSQPVSTSDLQMDYAKANLLMPPLEQLDQSTLHFALVVTWGTIADFEDALAASWRDRLLVAGTRRQPEWPESLEVISINSDDLEHSRKLTEAAARVCLARALASLPADDWWSTIGEYVQCLPSDVDTIAVKLNSWIGQLDTIESSRHPADLVRVIVCTILWLAKVDVGRSVKIIRDWLNTAGDSDESKLAQSVGAACGKALFRLHMHIDPPPSVETHDVLLSLAPSIAQLDWNSIAAVLEAVRRWAVRTEWATRLLIRPGGTHSEFVELIDIAAQNNYEALVSALETWPELTDTKPIPESVVQLLRSLRLRIALRTRKPLPPLGEGQSYYLVVVDVAGRSDQSRRRVGELAGKLVKRLNEEHKDRLLALGYKLGYDLPIRVLGEQFAPEAFIPANGEDRPALLGQILEAYAIEQVSFVVLFTNNAVLDEDDWRNTAWSDRVFRYSDGSQPRESPFAVIPKAADAEEIDSILHYLAQNRGV